MPVSFAGRAETSFCKAIDVRYFGANSQSGVEWFNSTLGYSTRLWEMTRVSRNNFMFRYIFFLLTFSFYSCSTIMIKRPIRRSFLSILLSAICFCLLSCSSSSDLLAAARTPDGFSDIKTEKMIPKTVNHLWITNPSAPVDFFMTENLKTQVELYTTWHHVLWINVPETDLPYAIKQAQELGFEIRQLSTLETQYPELLNLVLSFSIPGVDFTQANYGRDKSTLVDISKYLITESCGGLIIDLNYDAKNVLLDSLLYKHGFIKQHYENSLFAAVPHHQLMQKVLDALYMILINNQCVQIGSSMFSSLGVDGPDVDGPNDIAFKLYSSLTYPDTQKEIVDIFRLDHCRESDTTGGPDCIFSEDGLLEPILIGEDHHQMSNVP